VGRKTGISILPDVPQRWRGNQIHFHGAVTAWMYVPDCSSITKPGDQTTFMAHCLQPPLKGITAEVTQVLRSNKVSMQPMYYNVRALIESTLSLFALISDYQSLFWSILLPSSL
jgi:hypothetical protein